MPQVAQHVEAVLARQHHVEQHEIELARRRLVQAALAVGGRVHLIAFAPQAIGQRQLQPGFVLDEQDAGGVAHEA